MKTSYDKDKIIKQINWINENLSKSERIENVKQCCKDEKYGYHIPHINKENYSEIYCKIIENNNYNILLVDKSIINFYYIFDEKGNIKLFNISYIPTFESDEEFDVQISKYLRFDYSQEGYKEIKHTKCHLHIGIEKNDLRIPVASLIYPKDMLYIVLKYIYGEESQLIDLIQFDRKKLVLSEKEKDKFRILIGTL